MFNWITGEKGMGLQEAWEKASTETEMIRCRRSLLSSCRTEELSYVFLSESEVNVGDTLVRKGKVLIHKPSIILPHHCPQLEGFGFDKDHGVNNEMVKTFLLIRGVTLPSFEFTNEIAGMDLYEGSLDYAIEHYLDEFEKAEDIDTSLVSGPGEYYQFSVLVFIAAMVGRSASSDLDKLMKDLRNKGRDKAQ
jgi:hypothetical protein